LVNRNGACPIGAETALLRLFFALWVTCGGEAAEKVGVFREMIQQKVTSAIDGDAITNYGMKRKKKIMYRLTLHEEL